VIAVRFLHLSDSSDMGAAMIRARRMARSLPGDDGGHRGSCGAAHRIIRRQGRVIRATF
jgi:hypothetical protein